MFTGIVIDQGTLTASAPSAAGRRMTFEVTGGLPEDTRVGDSMSVSGVCLTMLDVSVNSFSADLSGETLSRSTLGGLSEGNKVNLEPALRASDRLGGHLVSGHVDGLGTLIGREDKGDTSLLTFELPGELARYISVKGSICLDGVSLTINEVDGARLQVCIIPHTLDVTTLGQLKPGDPVNVEVDLVARYLERLLRHDES